MMEPHAPSPRCSAPLAADESPPLTTTAMNGSDVPPAVLSDTISTLAVHDGAGPAASAPTTTLAQAHTVLSCPAASAPGPTLLQAHTLLSSPAASSAPTTTLLQAPPVLSSCVHCHQTPFLPCRERPEGPAPAQHLNAPATNEPLIELYRPPWHCAECHVRCTKDKLVTRTAQTVIPTYFGDCSGQTSYHSPSYSYRVFTPDSPPWSAKKRARVPIACLRCKTFLDGQSPCCPHCASSPHNEYLFSYNNPALLCVNCGYTIVDADNNRAPRGVVAVAFHTGHKCALLDECMVQPSSCCASTSCCTSTSSPACSTSSCSYAMLSSGTFCSSSFSSQTTSMSSQTRSMSSSLPAMSCSSSPLLVSSASAPSSSQLTSVPPSSAFSVTSSSSMALSSANLQAAMSLIPPAMSRIPPVMPQTPPGRPHVRAAVSPTTSQQHAFNPSLALDSHAFDHHVKRLQAQQPVVNPYGAALLQLIDILDLGHDIPAIRNVNRILDGLRGDVPRTVARWLELADAKQQRNRGMMASSERTNSSALSGSGDDEKAAVVMEAASTPLSSAHACHQDVLEETDDWDTVMDQEEQLLQQQYEAADQALSDQALRDQEEEQEGDEQNASAHDGPASPARFSVLRCAFVDARGQPCSPVHAQSFRVVGCSSCDLCCDQELARTYCIVSHSGRIVTEMAIVQRGDLSSFLESSYVVCGHCVRHIQQCLNHSPKIVPTGALNASLLPPRNKEEAATPTMFSDDSLSVSGPPPPPPPEHKVTTDESPTELWRARLGFQNTQQLLAYFEKWPPTTSTDGGAHCVGSCIKAVPYGSVMHHVLEPAVTQDVEQHNTVSELRPPRCVCGALIIALLQHRDNCIDGRHPDEEVTTRRTQTEPEAHYYAQHQACP